MITQTLEQPLHFSVHIDSLVQERCNSNAFAKELRLSCPNPLIYDGFSYTCSQLCIIKDKDLIINAHNEYVPTIKSKWQKKAWYR